MGWHAARSKAARARYLCSPRVMSRSMQIDARKLSRSAWNRKSQLRCGTSATLDRDVLHAACVDPRTTAGHKEPVKKV